MEIDHRAGVEKSMFFEREFGKQLAADLSWIPVSSSLNGLQAWRQVSGLS
jgi:hypothetical protein